MLLVNMNRFSIILPTRLLSDCNTSFFEDLFEANNLPMCIQEIEATLAYLASLVDDIQSDALSNADFLEWFELMGGNKYASGTNCELYLLPPKAMLQLPGYVWLK